MKILETITLARLDDGTVRQIAADMNLGTANIFSVPVFAVKCEKMFEIIPCRDKQHLVSDPESIIRTVCMFFNIDPKDVVKKHRYRQLVLARNFCSYFLRQKTNLTLLDVGEMLGGRDHTTIIHGLQSIEELCSVPGVYQDMLRNLNMELARFPDITFKQQVRPPKKQIKVLKMPATKVDASESIAPIIAQVRHLKEKYAAKNEPIVRAKW